MYKALTLAIALGAVIPMPLLAQSTDDYDEGWHRASFWSGEYPGGFSVLADTTVMLRPQLDPKVEKSVRCPLPAKATYQPWNSARVESDGLLFVSFTEIEEMEIIRAFTSEFYVEATGEAVTLAFDPGMTWRYLAYFGEGAFLMEHDGVQYTGDQGLLEASRSTLRREAGYDEWLRINCSNNHWGWLSLDDIVVDDELFTAPNVLGYGEAADLD